MKVGERVTHWKGGRCVSDEYQPEAQPWKYGLVIFGSRLGKPVGDGWVRVYGDGLNYPYLNERGERVG